MPVTNATAASAPARKLGRFELQLLLGRSGRSMAWRALDPQRGKELVLVMPRQQPATPAALARWLEQARRGARLAHPNLALALEVGTQENWPFVAYDGAGGPTLAERRAMARPAPTSPNGSRRRSRVWRSRTTRASCTATCSPSC